MIKFMNPLKLLTDVFEENYPEVKVNIKFSPFIRGRKFLFLKFGYWGETFFPNKEDLDSNDDYIDILVSTHLSIENSVEIVAHELAHAIAGINAGHGKEWEEIFGNLQFLYNIKILESYE